MILLKYVSKNLTGHTHTPARARARTHAQSENNFVELSVQLLDYQNNYIKHFKRC